MWRRPATPERAQINAHLAANATHAVWLPKLTDTFSRREPLGSISRALSSSSLHDSYRAQTHQWLRASRLGSFFDLLAALQAELGESLVERDTQVGT